MRMLKLRKTDTYEASTFQVSGIQFNRGTWSNPTDGNHTLLSAATVERNARKSARNLHALPLQAQSAMMPFPIAEVRHSAQRGAPMLML